MSKSECGVTELLKSPVSSALQALFEHVPGVFFFVKDKGGRFVHANAALVQRLGLRELAELVGTSDYDRYPAQVADQLRAGDEQIMRSGKPLIDHLEVLFDQMGRLEWFSTTKHPVFSKTGEALGVVGITRSYSARKNHQFHNLAAGRAIDFICEHPTETLRVAAIAKKFGISERQLNRQFLSLVKLPPREFIVRSRVQAATVDLKDSDESIASIAEKFGFCDQSAFTKQFRRIMGTTPSRYRKSFSVS